MSGEPTRAFRILLVEDEPVIRELVKSMLSDGAVTVDSAGNGVEGLKLARTNAYDLILLDVVLPQMDGITVCRMLKSDAATARVPLYMLTAKSKLTTLCTETTSGVAMPASRR